MTEYGIIYERKHIWSPPKWTVVNQYGEVISRHVTKKLAQGEIRLLKAAARQREAVEKHPRKS